MKKAVFSIVTFFLCIVMISCSQSDDDDDDTAESLVPDSGFETCVREAISKPEGDLNEIDLSGITSLICADYGISSISGCEYMNSLTSLSVWENNIADITPLQNLSGLVNLQLGNNQIDDVSALQHLTNLTVLGLGINNIEEIEPLASLVNLTWLNLDNNRLDDNDLGNLCDLEKLRWLTVEHNNISSINELMSCLGSCEIYWEFQGEPPHASASDSSVATMNSDSPMKSQSLVNLFQARSRISFRVGENDTVHLYLTDGGETYSIIEEFPGEITFDGRFFSYMNGEQAVRIGENISEHIQLCTGRYAPVCSFSLGIKRSESVDGTEHYSGNTRTVVSGYLSVSEEYSPGNGQNMPNSSNDIPFEIDRYDTLDPYVLASPNQFDAGSCLFMASTGAMEILLNQHTSLNAISYKGDTDLSERYLMNVLDLVDFDGYNPWIFTDLIYTYPYFGGSMLDRDYPFIADYVRISGGNIVPAEPDDPGAFLSCMASWFNDLPENWESMLVPTPDPARTVIFIDPARDANSQWAVGIADHAVLDIIKHELVSKNAPVLVVYNHYLYWHADLIVGFDDNAPTNGCPMVESSLAYFEEQGATSHVNAILDHMEELGGCLDSGKFYVRDSIYSGGADEPMYTYSEEFGFEDKYAKRIIERTYNWILYLANHAYSVHRK